MAHTSKLRDIFATATELSPGPEREAFLEEACGDESELRREIEELLKAEEDAGSFFQDDGTEAFPQKGGLDLVGAIIGPYRICEKIGEGGFGVVYVAEQTKVRRRVALKVIKPGMESKEVIARFEVERQALAMMEHSNIATVFDAGMTEQGLPYFVMELVDGCPITRFCDDRKIALRDRLELFCDACHAVQHAHQKGIIHRDIKPSNVLVTINEGKPVVKVIDFGVAKALDTELTTQALLTNHLQLIGTPLYMSPEQANRVHDVDTRSDIYSLGVLLYELIVGMTPFSRQQLQKAGIDRLRRIICEEEPTRPSAKINTLGDAIAKIASARGTDPKQLSAAVRGDLDWIVMKALEKDRNRRYATALALAEDVAAHLNHQPVTASPPSFAYRFRKFSARNRAALTTCVIVAFTLLAGVVGTLWQAIQADSARDRAVKAERLAELRLADVLKQQEETNQALAKTLAAEDAQRQLRLRAESRERFSRQLVYASDIRMAALARDRGDTRTFEDLLQRQIPEDGERDLRSLEWSFLKARSDPEYHELDLAADGCCLVHYCSTLDRVVTGHYSGRLHLFEPDSYRHHKTVSAHPAFVNGVDVSPDGTTLATVGDDGFLRLWDTETYQEIKKTRADAGHGHRVYFVHDGQMLLTSGEEPRVKLWDAGTLEKIDEFTGFAKTPHHGVKSRLAVTSDRRLAAMADQVNIARVYDLQSREITCNLNLASGGYVTCLEFSPDQSLIAGGRRDRSVTVWNAETGKVIAQLQGHLDDVQSVSFHPDGDRLATSDKSGIVRVWRVSNESGKETRLSETWGWPASFAAHEDRVWSLDFSPDGTELITGCRDGSVRVWPASEAVTFRIAETPQLEPRACWLNSETAVVSADDHLVFWNPSLATTYQSETFSSGVQSLAITSDRTLLATGHTDGRIRIWDCKSKQVVDCWTAHRSAVYELCFADDTPRLASCSEDGRAIVWDRPSREPVASFEFPNLCKAIALDPAGQNVAIAVQNEIHLGEVASQTSRQLQGHLNSVDCLLFTNDGQKLVSGSDDRTLRIWHVGDGSVEHVIHANKNKIESLTLSPNGRTILSGDKDGRFAFSHFPTARYLYDLDVLQYWPKEDLPDLDHWVSDLDVSPDGQRVLAGVFRVGYIVLGETAAPVGDP